MMWVFWHAFVMFYKKLVFCLSDLWRDGGGLLSSGSICYWTKLSCISRKKKAYSLRLLRSESYFFITNCNWGTSVASSYLLCLALSQGQHSTTSSGSTSTAPSWTITRRKSCKFKSILYKQHVQYFNFIIIRHVGLYKREAYFSDIQSRPTVHMMFAWQNIYFICIAMPQWTAG